MSLAKADFQQVGLVRKTCADAGILGLRDIADAAHRLKARQTLLGLWMYDHVTKHGSASEGLMRNRRDESEQNCIIWSLNHYLGLNRHPDVIEATCEATRLFGTGCGTSAMAGGGSSLHTRLEWKLAEWTGKEDAIIFPTGYSANLGAISALARGKSTIVLFDRECHASIIDGIRLSGAPFRPFRHNDLDDLCRKLIDADGAYENVLVIVESIYSMSGDRAPLADICDLKKKTPFLLYVDEAHSFGLLPERTYCNALGVTDQVDFIMTTLSKSVASIGGVVATSAAFRTLLQIEANPFVLQAASPPADIAATLAAMAVIEAEPDRIADLWHKTRIMRSRLREAGFDIGSGDSPIIPVYVRDSELLLLMGRDLLERGIFVTPIIYPAVKHSEVRFRFILNVSHTLDQIDFTVRELKAIGQRYGIL